MGKAGFNHKGFFLLSLSFLLLWKPVFSQVSINLDDLQTLKVDDYTDEQLKEFYVRIQRKGLDLMNLEAEAKKRGMPEKEWQKLKSRLEKLMNEKSREEEATRKNKNIDPVKNKEAVIPDENSIFGSELFANKTLSFEPDYQIATPASYTLGPGDVLHIDIYGYSEQSFQIKVSPDGYIRIPEMGMVSVTGLSIEQARVRIRQNLSGYIEGLKTGNTKVNITLGNIRSVRVMITGEVNNPGSYTLPSTATLLNALYAAGGPNNNRSYRNIVLVRNNKIVSRLDIYEFLKTGIFKENLHIQDQDVIKVFPYENRVQLKGMVKHPGYFEMRQKESLQDLLNTAGGFQANAYQGLIKVTRNNAKQKSVADIPQELFKMFVCQNGDRFLVDSILNRFENRVQIKGAVFRPGDYAIQEGLTVSQLIQKADGITEDAFTGRAIIYRLREDNSLEMLSFNVTDVLNHQNDIPLKREDLVMIASKLDMKEGFKVTINGEVIKPGTYSYAEKMHLQDLIIAAGGLKETASLKRIEVARRKFDIDKMSLSTEISIVKQFDIDKDLKGSQDVDFELQPFDVITIFKEAGFAQQKLVKIEGQVIYPGVYSIQRSDEKVTDLIKRAGGISANGFADGAILMRYKSQNATQDLMDYQKKLALARQSKDSNNVNKLEKESDELNYDIVGIDLVKLLKNPDSKENLLLREGDVLVIPDQRQTVLVSGEVLYPVRLKYIKGQSFKSYIKKSGGFGSRALKRRSYVVYANGTADATRNFVIFKKYPRIKPGAEIVVPQKEARKQVSTLEFVTILTSVTSLLVLISTLVN